MVTTEYRGVFVGEINDAQDLSARSMPMKNARMAIRWGTTTGVMELALTGPTKNSLISAVADIPMLHGITAIFAITPAAWQKWIKS